MAVVITAFRYAPVFQKIFLGLGAELPLVTRAVFATYYAWPVVPVVFGALAIDAIRKPRSPRYVGILAALAVAAGFFLQSLLFEAYFIPMLALIKQIG